MAANVGGAGTPVITAESVLACSDSSGANLVSSALLEGVTGLVTPVSDTGGTQSATVAPYGHDAQMLFLSCLPYFSNKFQGTREAIEASTATALSSFLRRGDVIQRIGTWEVVWGPVCNVSLTGVVDNAFLVLRNVVTPTTYCISICGTNPRSLNSWLFQDFNISLVQWPYATPTRTGACVAHGYLNVIEWMSSVTATGVSLHTFLSKETEELNCQGKKMHLIVTGHSLGGGLTPTLALFLADTVHLWDPKSVATIETVPIAGPTSGDTKFAQYAEEKLGAHFHPIRNHFDIVTHGWNRDLLLQIPSLYEPVLPLKELQLPLQFLLAMNKSDYQHIKPSQGWLLTTKPTVKKSAFSEITYQHLKAYFFALGCTDMLKIIGPEIPIFQLDSESDMTIVGTIGQLLGLRSSS
ncbi:lipase family protein [Pelomyxa schiedti]|nr:lipase family protein [Pelomyxa schiedti]